MGRSDAAPPAAPLPTVGGMALVEGVMMRGPQRWAAAIRRSSGEIEVIGGDVPGWSRRAAAIPLVRGVAAIADAMALGVRVLLWSGDRHERDRRGLAAREGALASIRIGPALVPALAITIALFFLLPAGLATLAAGDVAPAAFNAVETGIRLVVLVAYLVLVRQLRDVRRVFEHHGAEHKAVAAYEHLGGAGELSVPAVQACSTRHLRCGTTFLLVVVVLSGLVHLLVGHPSLPVLLVSRALLVPLVAAVAYELVTWVARRPEGRRRAVLVPGLGLQGLTTAEPSDDQVELAIVALQHALAPAAATVQLAAAPRTLHAGPVAAAAPGTAG